MATSRLTLLTKEHEIFVGTRVTVFLPLFNAKDASEAVGLVVNLSARRPDGTEIDIGPMAEDPDRPGTYAGTFLVDVKGEWTAMATVVAPETPFEERFHVKARS